MQDILNKKLPSLFVLANPKLRIREKPFTYLGNTINLASRIESHTKTEASAFLISDETLALCDLPKGMSFTSKGAFELKGAERPLSISRLEVC